MKENFYSKKKKIQFNFRTLFLCLFLSLSLKSSESSSRLVENYLYSQTGRDDEKKELPLFLLSLFLCVLVEVVSRFFI